MTANELVTVARLADHYEKRVSQEHDPLELAAHDFNKFKRDAPELWRFLRESDRSDREIGDWLSAFFVRKASSGMTLKNFAATEFEQIAAGPHHATKKSPAQLQREIDAVLARKGSQLSHSTKAGASKAALTPARLSKAARAKLGVALRREIKNETLLAGYRPMRHDDYQRAGEAAIKACGLYNRAAAQAGDDGVEIFEIVDGAPHVDQGAMVRWRREDD